MNVEIKVGRQCRCAFSFEWLISLNETAKQIELV